MRAELQAEGIIKEEKVGYLKSKINLQQGTLFLTSGRIVLEAGKASVGGFGLLGALLGSKVAKKSAVLNLSFDRVANIVQGKHGVQKNVLEITDAGGATFRIMVKDYGEWEEALRPKISPSA